MVVLLQSENSIQNISRYKYCLSKYTQAWKLW